MLELSIADDREVAIGGGAQGSLSSYFLSVVGHESHFVFLLLGRAAQCGS